MTLMAVIDVDENRWGFEGRQCTYCINPARYRLSCGPVTLFSCHTDFDWAMERIEAISSGTSNLNINERQGT